MLDDFTQWHEIFNNVYTAPRDSCNRQAIPEISISSSTTRVLSVGCFSNSITENSFLAGWLHQRIILPFRELYYFDKKCFVNRYNLVILPDIQPFTISFKPVYWLDDIRLVISEYRGEYPQ